MQLNDLRPQWGSRKIVTRRSVFFSALPAARMNSQALPLWWRGALASGGQQPLAMRLLNYWFHNHNRVDALQSTLLV